MVALTDKHPLLDTKQLLHDILGCNIHYLRCLSGIVEQNPKFEIDHIIFKHRKKLLFPGIFSGNNFSRTEAGALVTKFEHIILELLEPPRILL